MELLGAEQLVFYFLFYSTVGWILETIYKSFENRRFVNSGFLFGPYVPVYGFCALITISAEAALGELVPFGVRLALYTFVAIVLEYYTALIGEQIFGIRLWDYRNKPFNLHGRICLQYSSYWLLLSAVQMLLIQPSAARLAALTPDRALLGINRVFLAGMLIDFIFASRNLRNIVGFFNLLDKNYLSTTRESVIKSIVSFKRLLGSFPNLTTYITLNIKNHLLPDFNMGLQDIFRRRLFRESRGAAVMENGGDNETEFNAIVADIIDNPTFLKLRDFKHHNGSIFDHVKAVAYFTYRFCRQKQLDYKSATRGALLHDFFMYDWRTGRDASGKYHKGHIYLHPKMALENAGRLFSLNDMERDIILNHMWPLAPSIPRYKETYIVSFIDKYIATREFLDMLRKSLSSSGDG